MMGGRIDDHRLATSMRGWQGQHGSGYGVPRLPWSPIPGMGRGLSNAEGDRLWRAIGGWSY